MSDEILIPVPAPMTREHAHLFAVQELGRGAIVGVNSQYPDAPYHVGVKDKGEWTKIGFGKTWEEAFANVNEVAFQRGNGAFVFKKDLEAKAT
jgi:hypothetical protein